MSHVALHSNLSIFTLVQWAYVYKRLMMVNKISYHSFMNTPWLDILTLDIFIIFEKVCVQWYIPFYICIYVINWPILCLGTWECKNLQTDSGRSIFIFHIIHVDFTYNLCSVFISITFTGDLLVAYWWPTGGSTGGLLVAYWWLTGGLLVIYGWFTK